MEEGQETAEDIPDQGHLIAIDIMEEGVAPEVALGHLTVMGVVEGAVGAHMEITKAVSLGVLHQIEKKYLERRYPQLWWSD